MDVERDEHLRDRTCEWCKGAGGYWEQGPNAWTSCTQCNTNYNRIVGYVIACTCVPCLVQLGTVTD